MKTLPGAGEGSREGGGVLAGKIHGSGRSGEGRRREVAGGGGGGGGGGAPWGGAPPPPPPPLLAATNRGGATGNRGGWREPGLIQC
jgi:hypothetical protein